MPAPELPEAERPEADEPMLDTPQPDAVEITPESEAFGGEIAAEEIVTGETVLDDALPAALADVQPEEGEALDAVPAEEPFAAAESWAASEASDDLVTPADTEAAPAVESALPAQRPQLSVVAAGLLLIGLGVILIWPALSGGFILVPGLIILIIALGLTLTLLAYWQDSARRARGALFLSLLCLTWGLLTGILLLAPELGGLARLGPFYALALGLAALLTSLGERPVEARLVAVGLVAIAAGGATVAVTWDLLQADVLAATRQFGPWLLVLLALGLLPLVIRHGRASGSSDVSS